MKVRNCKGLHQHWTQKGGVMKPKAQFNTLDDALSFLSQKNILTRYHPYVCPDCGKWHIGHNKK